MKINQLSQKLTRNLKVASIFLVLQFAMSTNGYAIKLVLDGEPKAPNITVLDLTDDVVYDYDDTFRPLVTNTDLPFLCLGPKVVGGGSNPNVSFGMSSSDVFKVQGLVGVSSVIYDYNPVLLLDKEVKIQTTDDSQCVVDGYVSNIVIPDGIFTNGFENVIGAVVNPREISLEILDIYDQVLSRTTTVTHNNDFTYKYKITNNTNDVTSVSMADYYDRFPGAGQPHFSTVLSENVWSCVPSTAASDCDTEDPSPVSGEQGEVYLTDIELAANENVVITVIRKPIVTVNGATIALLASALVLDGKDVIPSDNTDTRTFSVSTINPTKLNIVTQPGSSYMAGSSISDVVVQIQDVGNNLDTGNTSNVTIAISNNPSTGTLSGVFTVAAVAGVATFSGLNLDKVGNGYTLNVTSAGLTNDVTSGIDIVVGPATQLAVTTQPTTTAAGDAIPDIVVQVQDIFGNLSTSSTNNIAIVIQNNPSGGTMSGSAIVTAVGGLATFTGLTIDNAGLGYSLSAFTGGLLDATSNNFDITAGPATQLAISNEPSATGITAGATLPVITVELQDTNGNINTGETSNVTISIATNPGGGALSGTLTVAAVAGIATFNNLSLDISGGYTLSITSGGLTNDTTSAINIVGGAATQIEITTQPVNTVAGVVMPGVIFTLKDAFGNIDTNNTDTVTIFILSNPASGTLSGTTSKAAVAGVVTFDDLSINNLGIGYTLRGVDAGLSATSSSFDIL